MHALRPLGVKSGRRRAWRKTSGISPLRDGRRGREMTPRALSRSYRTASVRTTAIEAHVVTEALRSFAHAPSQADGVEDTLYYYLRFLWWARQDLNLRPLRCQRSALPLSYAPANRGGRGAEPPVAAGVLVQSRRPWQASPRSRRSMKPSVQRSASIGKRLRPLPPIGGCLSGSNEKELSHSKARANH